MRFLPHAVRDEGRGGGGRITGGREVCCKRRPVGCREAQGPGIGAEGCQVPEGLQCAAGGRRGVGRAGSAEVHGPGVVSKLVA